MKSKRLLLIVALAGFLIAGAGRAETVEYLTGKDWKNISHQRKLYFIFGTEESPEYRGVIFSYSADEYTDLLDDKISKNPELKDTDMNEVFWSVIYENEPRNREVLDK